MAPKLDIDDFSVNETLDLAKRIAEKYYTDPEDMDNLTNFKKRISDIKLELVKYELLKEKFNKVSEILIDYF